MKNLLLEYTTIEAVAQGFQKIMQGIIGPVLSFIGVLGVVYAIVLGVQYAKAEDANKRKEVQGRLIGAAVGVIIIIVGAVLCFAIDWASIYTQFSGYTTTGGGTGTGTNGSLLWRL